MTVKAVRALAVADVVVYDRLVSPAILALAPQSAELIDVGKRAGFHPMPQDQINSLLVRLGQTSQTIVRLKGGDPFLFGRGGEEALALSAAGIDWEVVPGITSAQGCAATLKLPLTHRSLATGVRFVTGHCCQNGRLDHDWVGLADPATTLVVYMGLANIGEIIGQLIANGRDPATPVAVVSKGTLAAQRHVVSTLARVTADVATADLPSPVLFIIGEVVTLAGLSGTASHDPFQELVEAAQ
jgi:uroporphyrin-III C-methyltransferase